MSDKDYVYALRGIDLDIEQGEVLGIIGRNGAGKSTLLKILSRITGPSRGRVCLRGRIASLLEVGTGFHPELTGRENIYLNGTILGLTRREINQRLHDIVEFSGVARYLDTPVKRYSTGMLVRLGFAVAAHLDPEILLVDEVLAVGDAEFQQRAVGKMREISSGGARTVIIVSHNMRLIGEYCTRAVLLDAGEVAAIGDVDSVVERYLDLATEAGKAEFVFSAVNDIPACIRRIVLETAEGVPRASFPVGMTWQVRVEFEVHTRLPALHVVLCLNAKGDGGILAVTRTSARQVSPGRHAVIFRESDFHLASGRYSMTFCLVCGVKIQNLSRAVFLTIDDTVYAAPPRVLHSDRGMILNQLDTIFVDEVHGDGMPTR